MIKLYKSDDDQFYFTIVGLNGKTLATSETYKRKSNALKGIIALSEVLALAKKGEEVAFDDCTKIKK